MQSNDERNYVWVFKGTRIILRGKEIYCVHMEQRKTYVHTHNSIYRIGGSLKEAQKKLDGLPMVRIHNAYLVHLDHLESISVKGAVLKNGSSLPVSESHWKHVRETVESYYRCGRDRIKYKEKGQNYKKNTMLDKNS